MVIEETFGEDEFIFYCEYCYSGFEKYCDAVSCEKKCKKELG